MTIAIFSVLVFSVVQVGGTGAVLDNARALPGYLALDASYVEATGDSEPTPSCTSSPPCPGAWAIWGCPTSCCGLWPSRTRIS